MSPYVLGIGGFHKISTLSCRPNLIHSSFGGSPVHLPNKFLTKKTPCFQGFIKDYSKCIFRLVFRHIVKWEFTTFITSRSRFMVGKFCKVGTSFQICHYALFSFFAQTLPLLESKLYFYTKKTFFYHSPVCNQCFFGGEFSQLGEFFLRNLKKS